MSKQRTKITEHFLSDHERDNFTDEFTDVKYNSAGPFNSFVRAAKQAYLMAASPELDTILHEFKNDPRANGALMVHNCPFDPSVSRGLLEDEAASKVKKSYLSEGFLIGLVSQVGEPYSIQQEGHELVNNLCPSQEDRAQFTGLGSESDLGLHIENAAARLLPGDRAPDGLALTGVSREPGNGPATIISDGRLALSLCDAWVQQELRKPNYYVRFPNRWNASGTDEICLETSVVIGSTESPSFVAAFYDKILTSSTPRAEKALSEFSKALDAVAVAIHIQPGLTVLLNNHVVFHGRDSFKASFDQEGRPWRWVQRAFWLSSLRRMGDWKWVRDRVVHPVVGPELMP